MSQSEFQTLIPLAADSRIWRSAQRVIAACSLAWDASRVGRFLRAHGAPVACWPPAKRVRLGAMAIAWAGIFHLASLFMLPRYVAPALPYPWIALVIVTALIVAAFADAFAHAWPESTFGRIVNHILKG